MNIGEIKATACIRIVSEKYNVSVGEIIGRSRQSKIVKPRFLCFFLLKQMGFSAAEIARRFCRDHATISHGIEMVKKYYSSEAEEINIEGISLEDIAKMRNPYPLGKSKKWQWVYEIYQGKCVVCGFSNVVNVHHIKPRSIGGSDDISNLVLLCPNHHAMLHLGLVDISNLSTKTNNTPNELSTYPHV